MTTAEARIKAASWGTSGGKPVSLYRLQNASGAYVEVTNFGATLVAVVVPDKNGVLENVILGFPALDGYERDVCYVGSTIGRFANRIGGATFTLDGVKYDLDRNDGNNTNHGGEHGFHKRVFDTRVTGNEVLFSLISDDGDGGFPGKVTFRTSYKWSDDNELIIWYTAETDKTTVVNFTNHAYFNLTAGRSKIHDHRLVIEADRMLEITNDFIPTGKILHAGKLKFTGQRVQYNYEKENGVTKGRNSYFLFDQPPLSPPEPSCILTEQTTGRKLSVFTTYPGVQVYTGDYLNSVTPGNCGRLHEPFDGLCLECQYCPDSPNHASFPSTRLNPGQVFSHQIVYQFSLTDRL
jgi:aldose 1-epimerase